MKVHPCGVVAKCCLLGILTSPIASVAQTAQLGEIVGTVSNTLGQELSGARVVLSAPQGNETSRSVLTDSAGRYRLGNLPYGRYSLAATLTGFKPSDAHSLTVASAAETVDFILTAVSHSAASAAKPTPTFSAAGIQGTTAPSGYSAAASTEETSQVMDRVDGLDQEILSALPPGASPADCNKEADLLGAEQANPESFDTNHALGMFYFGHADFIQSIRYLTLAFKVKPDETNNSRALALAYIAAKQYSGAVALLQRMAERESTLPAPHKLLAVAYKASGHPQKAIAEYLSAAGLDASEPNIFECGIGLIGLGSSDTAAKLFASAMVTHPGSARLWMGLGIAQDLQNLKIDSIRTLLHAVDVDPEYLPPYAFLATFAGLSAETDTQILKRMAELVVAHPESPVAHYDYALALWKQQRVNPTSVSSADIESQLKLAVARDPKMAQAHFQLGALYAESGDYAGSTSELRETVQLEPGNAEAHYRLAEAYRREKQPELADVEIRKFEAMHAKGVGEESPELQKLFPQLSRQMSEAAPCHPANR
jgi:Flp pilus assembly protein TadD